ncbi:hypothetical protein Tco_1071757 [Tanacetum coccineum]
MESSDIAKAWEYKNQDKPHVLVVVVTMLETSPRARIKESFILVEGLQEFIDESFIELIDPMINYEGSAAGLQLPRSSTAMLIQYFVAAPHLRTGISLSLRLNVYTSLTRSSLASLSISSQIHK